MVPLEGMEFVSMYDLEWNPFCKQLATKRLFKFTRSIYDWPIIQNPGSLMSLYGPTFHVTPVDLRIIFQCNLYISCIMSCGNKIVVSKSLANLMILLASHDSKFSKIIYGT